MKRALMGSLALLLLASACAKTEGIGAGVDTAHATRSASASTTATATKRSSSRPPVARTSAPPVVSTKSTCKSTNYKLDYLDNFNQYHPDQLRVYRGDTVTFTNKDSSTPSGHSWTADDGSWNSPILKPGKSWTLNTRNVPLGKHLWHDANISYARGGPLEVLKSPC
jgi:plastocyanin